MAVIMVLVSVFVTPRVEWGSVCAHVWQGCTYPACGLGGAEVVGVKRGDETVGGWIYPALLDSSVWCFAAGQTMGVLNSL